jgi:hypothetical protein
MRFVDANACALCAEIDDAVAEFSVLRPPSPCGGLLAGGGTLHPSDAVKVLSAETGVRIHVPDRRERPHDSASAHRGRDRESHHSHSNLVITLEGEVANIFIAVAAFAAALSDPQLTPQPDSGCRFIGDATNDNNSSNSKDNWRHRDKDGEDSSAAAVNNYEQLVNIPSSLVGLLLAKRDPDLSVMKQIQRGSGTQAVKLAEPVLPPGHDRDEQEPGGGGGGKQDEVDCPSPLVDTFAVRGSRAAAVELAASCLLRIVAGDKIVNVLADLKAQNNNGDKSYVRVPDKKSSKKDGGSEDNQDDADGVDDAEGPSPSGQRHSSSSSSGRGGGRGGGKGRGRGRGGGGSGRGGGGGGRGGGSSSSKQSGKFVDKSNK